MLMFTILAEWHADILEDYPRIRSTRRWNDWTEYSIELTTEQIAWLRDLDESVFLPGDSSEPTGPCRVIFGISICQHGRTTEFYRLETYSESTGWLPIEVPEETDDIPLTKHLHRLIHDITPITKLLGLDHLLLQRHFAVLTATTNN